MKYSGLLKRLVAYSIDCLTLIGLYMVLGLVLGSSLFFHPLSMLPMVGFWFYGGIFFIAWLYFALLESSKWQATLGKKVLKIQVVDLEGHRIGFWRASSRYFCKFVSRIIFCIGFLMIPFTKKKQALHDKLASTLIIQK